MGEVVGLAASVAGLIQITAGITKLVFQYFSKVRFDQILRNTASIACGRTY
jgi:hypothetical protein